MSGKRSCYRNNVAVLTRECRSRSDAAWCGVRSDLHCLLIWFRILLLSIIKLHHVAKLQKYINDNNSEKCEPRHEKTCFLHMRKQKAQVSCAVIAQRINACAFATKTAQFSTSMYGPVCVGPGREPEDRFSLDDATMHENVSRLMIKPAFCICENRGAGQLRSNCAADQRLCFRYKNSTIPLHYEQPGLCRTWSGTLKTGFLTTMLISYKSCLYHKNLEYRFL